MLLAASLCRGAVCSGGRVGCKSGEQSPRRLGLGAVADRSLITLFALICRGVLCSSIVSISKFEICDLERVYAHRCMESRKCAFAIGS